MYSINAIVQYWIRARSNDNSRALSISKPVSRNLFLVPFLRHFHMRDVDSKIVIFLHGDHMQSQCEMHNVSIAGENTLISIYAAGDFFCTCRCLHEKQMLGGKIINLRGIRWRSLSCLGLGF